MHTYEPIIGIEVHVELGTASKMFCGCPADHFGKEPNTQTCPVCLGLPGALPVPNKKAVEWTILLGLALGCTINRESKFDRKHYFYPDLPKGYQISQYDEPIAKDGSLEIKSQIPNSKSQINSKSKIQNSKQIRIRRVHLEEDTGKLQHATIDGKRVSLVDFNRSGVPLVEIVTEPDFRSPEEVDLFAKKLQQIVRYLGISGADMEKGSMRIEPSISMRLVTGEKSQVKLPEYRVEIKNVNSFKFARNAIAYEIERQTQMLEQGEIPSQQTRGYVEAKGMTVAQREKEEAHDYRYFPEPDIPPLRWESSQLSAISSQLSELPEEKKERFIKEYELSEYDAGQLVETKASAKYFEACVNESMSRRVKENVSPKIIANWMINKKIDVAKISPEQLVKQIQQSSRIVEVSEDEINVIINQVLSEQSKAVADYKSGKTQVLMYLVGQGMRLAKGTSTAEVLKNALIKALSV